MKLVARHIPLIYSSPPRLLVVWATMSKNFTLLLFSEQPRQLYQQRADKSGIDGGRPLLASKGRHVQGILHSRGVNLQKAFVSSCAESAVRGETDALSFVERRDTFRSPS